MAYKPITISNFQDGVAPSPYLGFAKIVGLDIFRRPGVIQAGVRLDSAGYNLVGTPMAYCRAVSTGDEYIGTSGNGTVGRLYKNGVYMTNTSAPVHDVVYINDYLIITTSSSAIDVYGPLSSAPVFYLNKFSSNPLNTSVSGYKKAYVGRDNSVYIANENQIAMIYGTSGAFGSWGVNTSIISTGIPNNRIATTICDYDRYVAIMTSSANNSQNSRIYFLDLFQADNTSRQFKLTASTNIPERTCNMMINSNNRIFFFGNDTGTIYTTNMVSYSPVAVIPNRQLLQTYTTYPNGVAQVNNEILWGVGGAFNTAFDTVYGVYGLRDDSLYTKNIISSGNYGQTAAVSIPLVGSGPAGQYVCGWNDSANVGFDSASSNLATSYNAWFETKLFESGTAKSPRTFQTIEINFGQNLTTGQKIKVQWRRADNETWSDLKEFTFDNLGGVNSCHDKFPISTTTNIQLKVLFDVGSSAIYGTNIEVQSINLT